MTPHDTLRVVLGFVRAMLSIAVVVESSQAGKECVEMNDALEYLHVRE